MGLSPQSADGALDVVGEIQASVNVFAVGVTKEF